MVLAEYLNCLERQGLTAKKTVELLVERVDVGYAAVLCTLITGRLKPFQNDPATLPTVDLGDYDVLIRKEVSA